MRRNPGSMVNRKYMNTDTVLPANHPLGAGRSGGHLGTSEVAVGG
jgi:hypothetical protein